MVKYPIIVFFGANKLTMELLSLIVGSIIFLTFRVKDFAKLNSKLSFTLILTLNTD